MIQVIRPTLSQKASLKLDSYQNVVDTQAGFAAQVEFAKTDFPKKNQLRNATFNEVKSKLVEMCSGAKRCHYCEDSNADEVEHFHPKDVYPSFCYIWNNYFCSCSSCNTKKNNQCAVIDANGQLINTTPPRQKKGSPPVVPVAPPSGISAFVNPETENPLAFFFLDILAGTFEFSEYPDETTVEFTRAKHTLEVLQLNKQEYLRKARAHAYYDFKARLTEFIHCLNENAPQAQLDKMKEGVQIHAHPTVWKEMVRQKDFIPELKNLFDQSPEALLW